LALHATTHFHLALALRATAHFHLALALHATAHFHLALALHATTHFHLALALHATAHFHLALALHATLSALRLLPIPLAGTHFGAVFLIAARLSSLGVFTARMLSLSLVDLMLAVVGRLFVLESFLWERCSWEEGKNRGK
jgi:hypothetical protein